MAYKPQIKKLDYYESGGAATALPVYAWQDYEKTSTFVYVGYKEPSGAWYIYRRTIATNARLYARGAASYVAAWTARLSQTYL